MIAEASEVIRAVGLLVGTVALLSLSVGLLIALIKSRKVTSHIVTKLGSIDVAVNNVANGEPALIEKVRRIERAVHAICAHLRIEFHEQVDLAGFDAGWTAATVPAEPTAENTKGAASCAQTESERTSA